MRFPMFCCLALLLGGVVRVKGVLDVDDQVS